MIPRSGSAQGWTYSEYARLPDDGNRYEVIDGEVCVIPAPGPKHQRVAAALYRVLDDYVSRYGLGKMYWDVDLLFVAGQFLRPDMVFVPISALAGVTDRGVECAPGLVVEVVSPHSELIDRVKKPPRYRDFGVPEYWVVDPDARTVEVYRFASGRPDTPAAPEASVPASEAGVPTPGLNRETLRWQPDPRRPALELEVPELFSRA
jgi:Uma2 family endonuclease